MTASAGAARPDDSVLLYGHLDQQPEMAGWRDQQIEGLTVEVLQLGDRTPVIYNSHRQTRDVLRRGGASVACAASGRRSLRHNRRPRMKALIFDTETTGMVVWKKPPEHPDQPDLVQLAMLLVERDDWSIVARGSLVLQLAEGVQIEPEAEATHGISAADCERYGVAPIVAVSLFNQLCLQADVIVAHNISFDRSIMLTALHRLGNKPDRMGEKSLVCTKEATTDVLKLPGKYGYKWPTLAEAYRHYTGLEIEGAHDALADTLACLEVYRALVSEGVVA